MILTALHKKSTNLDDLVTVKTMGVSGLGREHSHRQANGQDRPGAEVDVEFPSTCQQQKRWGWRGKKTPPVLKIVCLYVCFFWRCIICRIYLKVICFMTWLDFWEPRPWFLAKTLRHWWTWDVQNDFISSSAEKRWWLSWLVGLMDSSTGWVGWWSSQLKMWKENRSKISCGKIYLYTIVLLDSNWLPVLVGDIFVISNCMEYFWLKLPVCCDPNPWSHTNSPRFLRHQPATDSESDQDFPQIPSKSWFKETESSPKSRHFVQWFVGFRVLTLTQLYPILHSLKLTAFLPLKIGRNPKGN